MTDQERIPILLTRELADQALAALKGSRSEWAFIAGIKGRQSAPTPYDDAIDAIAAQLRAQRGDAGEGE